MTMEGNSSYNLHDSPTRRINNSGQIINLKNLSNSSYPSPGGGQNHRGGGGNKSSSSFKTTSSHTTSLTSEMSISPTDEDHGINNKPKFTLSSPHSAEPPHGRFVTTTTTTEEKDEEELNNMSNNDSDGSMDDEYEDEVSTNENDDSYYDDNDNDDSENSSSSSDYEKNSSSEAISLSSSNSYFDGSDMARVDSGDSTTTSGGSIPPGWGETSAEGEGEGEGSSHAYLSSTFGIGNPEKMRMIQEENNNSINFDSIAAESSSPTKKKIKKNKNKRASSRSIDASKPRSQYSGIFAASYGSMSLGGDTSLSSMDTFHNSPVRRPMIRKTHTSEPPSLDTAKPTKSILREKKPPIIHQRRRYISSDDDESENLSSTYDDDDDESYASSEMSASTSDVPISDASMSVDDHGDGVNISSASYGSSFLATSSSSDDDDDGEAGSRDGDGDAFIRTSSSDTGDVSIPTMSTDDDDIKISLGSDSDEEYISESEIVHSTDHDDEEEEEEEYEEAYNPDDALQEQTQLQLPSHPPLLEESTSSSMQQYQQNSKQSLFSDENTLGFAGESWTTPISKGTLGTTTSAASSERALESQRSDGSWSLGANWAAPKEADDHWASRGEIHGIPEDDDYNHDSNNQGSPTKDTKKKDKSKKKTKSKNKKKGGSRRSLSSKGSSSRASSKSSVSSSKKKKSNNYSKLNISNSSEQNVTKDTPRSVDPFQTMATRQPQSAYDKDAPWYCGDDDDDDEFGGLGGENDDDLDSDSSSVLSAFKKKKRGDKSRTTKSNFNNYFDEEEEPAKEMSMSFSALLGGGGGSSKKKSSRKQQQQQPQAVLEGSMSLGDLNNNNNGGSMNNGGEKSMSFTNLQQSSVGGEKSMSFTNLQQSSVGSELRANDNRFPSSPLHLLPEESLHSASLDDFFSERDKDVPMRSQTGPSRGGGESSPQAADVSSDGMNSDAAGGGTEASSKNRGVEEDDKVVDNTRGKSIRNLQRIFIIGLVLFLIFDLVLLTIFLVRRDKDEKRTDDGAQTGSTVLATVPETLCWDWVPGEGKSLLCSVDDTASGGGAVANVVAEAIRVQSPERIDLALIPAGLAKADISKGDFTYADAGNVINGPSSSRRRHLRRGLELDGSDGSSLVILEGKGTKIVEVLESSLEDSLANGETHSYPYASGLRYSVDRDAPKEQRVVSPVVLNEDDVWGPLNNDRVYKIITTKEWADSYFPEQGKDVSSTNSLFALADYAQNVKTLREPVYSTREFVMTASTLDTQEPIEQEDESPVVEGEICLSWLPGDDISNLCTSEQTAARGGGVGNLVAWGVLTKLREFDQETDIFLLKASDCQLDLAAGPFDEQVATALIPQNDNIVLLTLSGYQVVEALEDSVQYALSVGTTANYGSYPYAGGLRFKVDPTKTFGNRVTDIDWFNRGEWKALSLGVNNYRVSTTFTLAEGNYGYSVLFDALARTDTNYMLRDLFLEYANDVGTLRNPPASQFSTQQYN